jgi:molybdenum cofactor cytidylyltransferase
VPIEHILVVLGPHVAELAPLAEAAGAQVHVLDQATPDMRATIERGLLWMESRFHPQPTDHWLLVPADHPTLQPNVVRALLTARQAYPDRSIFIPTYHGRRGHPTLIGWQHVDGVRQLPVGQGLNVYLRQQAERALEVPVDSGKILIDLDTPEDYERLLASWDHA